jgi:DNA-3-methyladenine glycosylase
MENHRRKSPSKKMKHPNPKLNANFYLQQDVVLIARQLLGKILVSPIDDQRVSGRIIETEAYGGVSDRASHAYGGRYTKRTQTLFEQGGIAYVYLCYGMHSLFNVVTNQKGTPHAVLIRAIKPLEGIEKMLQRRGKLKADASLCKGPATLTQALGITKDHNALSLLGDILWIEEGNIRKGEKIIATPRIGVDYAKEDALLPWRFSLC